jgi:hypothetical protein
LEVHGVAGAGFRGDVAGEESVSEAAFTLFIFTLSAVFKPATDVRLHGGPVVMARQEGMYFRVGNVVKVGVVLASEGFAEGRWNQDARGEVGIAIDVKAVAGGEGVGVDGVQASGVGELGGLPILEGRRKVS